jgi:hypothetical protein
MSMIITLIDGRPERVDFNLYREVHLQIADQKRSEGLVGEALDHAIVDATPAALKLAMTEQTKH